MEMVIRNLGFNLAEDWLFLVANPNTIDHKASPFEIDAIEKNVLPFELEQALGLIRLFYDRDGFLASLGRRHVGQVLGVLRPDHDRGNSACNRSEEHTSELQSLRHLVCR